MRFGGAGLVEVVFLVVKFGIALVDEVARVAEAEFFEVGGSDALEGDDRERVDEGAVAGAAAVPSAGRPTTTEVGVAGVLVADHAVAEVPLPPAVFALGQFGHFWRFVHVVHLVKSSVVVPDRWQMGGEELACFPYGRTEKWRRRVLFVMSD